MAAALPFILMAATAATSIIGQQNQAKAAQQTADWQARQHEQQAGQMRAAAQREAMEQRRQAQLAISRAQAVTGGGSTDEGVLDAIGDYAARGEYNALTAIYEGEESALGRQMQAEGLRMEGHNARRAANVSSLGTVFSTASSMFGKFGNGGFGSGGGGTGGYAPEAWRYSGSGMPN